MYMRMLSRGGYSQIVNTDVDANFSRAAGLSGTSVAQLVSRPLQLLLLYALLLLVNAVRRPDMRVPPSLFRMMFV